MGEDALKRCPLSLLPKALTEVSDKLKIMFPDRAYIVPLYYTLLTQPSSDSSGLLLPEARLIVPKPQDSEQLNGMHIPRPPKGSRK